MPIVAKSARLAKALGMPYVPLTANMLMFGPLGLVSYLPAKLKLRVLEPVLFDVPPDQDRYPRSRVFEEAEAIRQRMQISLYDMLRQRRSVWFG
jgi:1-acyl-sn-glycerol-3-phosphate acyltransferase